jgi:hypothetical protein
VEWLRHNDFAEGQYEIFTDGAWKDHTPWLQHCFHGTDPDCTVGSASVTCIHIGEDRWTKPGLIMHIAPTPELHLSSGYPAELTALLCASQVALMWKPAAIITDCESAVGLIQKGHIPRAEQKLNHATLARLLVRYSRILTSAMYRHTHAHLDRYLPDHLHTPDQRGNILADNAASQDPVHAQWIATHYPQLTRRATTMQRVHESLLDDIPLCVTDGRVPALLSLHNTFSNNNFKQYVSDRLAQTTHGNLYRDASYHLCTQIYDLDLGDKADITQKASCVRLIFDKVWQPWNTRKYKKLSPPRCAHCEVEDSLGHLLRDCTDPAINRLRRSAMDAARLVVAQGDDIMHVVFDAILEIIAEPEGASIWRGLWLPQHIESFRVKLHEAGLVGLNPTHIQYDSPRSRAIHSATLDVCKILGQAALNMMRERNAQTQDALHPTRAQRAGKHAPPPLELYDKQKKFSKRSRKQAKPAPLTTRVMSMHPAFIKEKRKHPRVLGQEYRRTLEVAAEVAAAEAAREQAELQAAVYAEAFAIAEEVIQPWDVRVVPYLEEHALANEDEWDRTNRLILDQAHRARIYEEIADREELARAAEARRQAVERTRAQDALDREDPMVIDAIRRQRAVFGRRRFTRESVDASARWSARCSALANAMAEAATSTLATLYPRPDQVPPEPDPREPPAQDDPRPSPLPNGEAATLRPPPSDNTTFTMCNDRNTLRILDTTRNHQDGQVMSGTHAPAFPSQSSPPPRRAAGHFPMLDDHG